VTASLGLVRASGQLVSDPAGLRYGHPAQRPVTVHQPKVSAGGVHVQLTVPRKNKNVSFHKTSS
jgi:hypothetical protein